MKSVDTKTIGDLNFDGCRKEYDPYPISAQDAVERWDKGETIWTIEMGGLGPGYEQAIQMLMIEILRDHPDPKEIPENKEELQKWFDNVFGQNTIHRTNETAGGYSGAQVSAAKWLAYKFLFEGWKAVMKNENAKDRKIMVSNFWPKAS